MGSYASPYMLVLFLVYFLSAKAAPIPAVTDEGTSSSCKDIDNCRTLLGIIWSCLSTIFLCTWVAIHPNIPEPIFRRASAPKRLNTQYMNLWEKSVYEISCFKDICMERVACFKDKISSFVKNKVPLFMVALIVPEYILAWALRQYLWAGTVKRKFEEQNPSVEFTRTHGFFVIMGGFYYIEGLEGEDKIQKGTEEGSIVEVGDLNSHEMTGRYPDDDPLIRSDGISNISREKRLHPLTWENVISMVKNKQIKLPTEREIQDKSKSDWFAKILVLLQTLWFVTQCIARRLERLPTTELEIITLAYAAVNLGIFFAWLDKPRNVECPIQVFEEPIEKDDAMETNWWWRIILPIVGQQDDWIDLDKENQVPMFYSGSPEEREVYIADVITLAIGVVFGGIHCIAWSFDFPSHAELVLWRISSIAITAIPVLLSFLSAISISNALNSSENLWAKLLFVLSTIMAAISLLSMPLCALLYPAARLTTLVLAFMNLSSLPPGTLEAVHWTTLIPHL